MSDHARIQALEQALAALQQERDEAQRQIGELLQAVSARTSERDQARAAMGMLDTAYGKEHQRADTAEAQLASLTEARDGLQADYDETRKELNRVANLLAEECLALAALRDTRHNPACSRCGGPHPFDTTVPSVVWNATIRARGLEEYLCLTCIVTAFACFGESFTAELNGGPFQGGLPIEVRIRDCVATDAARISEENTALRFQIASLAEARDGLQAQNEILVMDASDSNACCEQAEAKLSALTAAHARVRISLREAIDGYAASHKYDHSEWHFDHDDLPSEECPECQAHRNVIAKWEAALVPPEGTAVATDAEPPKSAEPGKP